MVLGVLSLTRLFIEVLVHAVPNDRMCAFLLFDLTVAAFWIAGGWFLLQRAECALTLTAIAAGGAAARTIICLMHLVPRLTKVAWDAREDTDFVNLLAAVTSRVLHYGIEFIYWPIVLFFILKASETRRSRWQPDPEKLTGTAFAVAGVIGAFVELVILAPL